MAAAFAELHCHSNFSFLDGASAADDLVERAVELGLGAVAVTDHQGLYGVVRFAIAADEAGLKPIVGLEVELIDAAVPDPGRIVVPRRRRTRAERLGLDRVQPVWDREPGGGQVGGGRVEGGRVDGGPVDGGRVERPRAERLRLPGHREPFREDLRGVADAQRGPHLVLLARDAAGYRSLCRLVSAAHLAGTKGAPRFTQELLAKHAEGLVALSGCRHGEIARRLLAGDRDGAAAVARRYSGLYRGVPGVGGRGASGFFLELQHHLLPDDDWLVAETVALAGELGLATVVTNDAHYARPEDREMQDVLVCIRHGLTLEESAHLRRPNGEYHLKSEAELRSLPPAAPDADPAVRRAWAEGMRVAGELAERCTVDLGFERYRFPGFPVPAGETAFSVLEDLCHTGVRRRYHPVTPHVLKQLAHELEVIERTGLAEFFLICWDLMHFAREQHIPAQGRGSAGDSIVAYVLGITRVDPIRHRLLFERFINEGRTSYPDVDIDFASSRREEVIQYVYERYGQAHTGMVCNVVTYRARSAVREIGYALGFPRPLVDRVAKALETYDSVMVRRDLEAEGGFAEFFQVPGDGAAGVGEVAGRGVGPGSSPAAGGSLPQAVAAAAATEAARVAEGLARSQGFVDSMGELAHARGGRVATGGAGEHGTGRLVRREDEGRVEAGPGVVNEASGARDPHRSHLGQSGRGIAAAEGGGVDEAGEHKPMHDRLAPWTELRRGPSDDEGGPGDTPASIAFFRREHEAREAIAREREARASAGRDPTVVRGGSSDVSPVGLLPSHGFDPAEAGSGLELVGSASDRPFQGEPGLEIGSDRPSPPASAGEMGPDDARARPEDVETVLGTSSTGEVRRRQLSDPPDSYRPPVLVDPATGRAQIIDAGTGVLVDADRTPATRRLGRGGSVPEREHGALGAHGNRTPHEGHIDADHTRRLKDTSLGGIELDPLPAHRSGSTIGLSPWERWLELCARIDGFPRHLSIHTGGMLVTAAPLVDIAPLEHATMPGRVVVQYDKRDIETIKLIKLDLLGLRMLSAIDDALRDIQADCAVHVDLDRLPEDITEVFRMIQAADTVGVFQIESRAQMQTLPKSRPTCLDDLVVEVAIIRPGPIQGNAVHPYLRRKQGLEPVQYLHPSLEPALAETLGVILYQEQVMKIAIDVAGYSAAESDGFRRAMGTWRSSKEMEKLHERFVDGCQEKSGLTEEQAEELYRQVAGFASFGFNKSHAAAFARTAYESSFLKLFYPAQFICGLINAQPMGFYPVEVLINDAKRHGVAVLPVDVNRSRYRTTTEWVGLPGTPLPEGAGIDRRPVVVRSSGCVVPSRQAREAFAADAARGYGIRLGLHLVKGIGEEQMKRLDAELERGPYRSLAEVVARTELPEQVIERLIRAGALDPLGAERRRLLWELREVASATRGRVDGRSVGARSKKAEGRPLDLRLPPTEAPDLPAPTELERLGDAYAILSLDARRQVIELFRPALDRLGAVPAASLTDLRPGRVAIGGLVVTRQHPMTARGTVFLALEDESGMVNVTLWPDTWARLRGIVRRHALLYVEGELQRESNVVNLIAQRIEALPELARRTGGPDKPDGVRHLGHAGMRRLG